MEDNFVEAQVPVEVVDNLGKLFLSTAIFELNLVLPVDNEERVPDFDEST